MISLVLKVLFVALGAFVVLTVVLVPFSRGLRARPQGDVTACKSNLKNIGTALEMYSNDNLGLYPPRLGLIAPRYLRSLPTCPSASSVTYLDGYTVHNAPASRSRVRLGATSSYTVACAGNNHSGVGDAPGFPQYTSQSGLVDH